MPSDTQTFDIRIDSLANVFNGLQNPYTGMGNPYVDPTQHVYIQPGLSRLSREQQSALVRQNGLLKKLTTNLPKAATWRWGRPTLASGDAKTLQAIAQAVNAIRVVTPLQRLGQTKKGYQVAGELALQTGNAGLVLDIDDGRRLDEPIDLKSIKRINKMALLSRHTLIPDLTNLSRGLPEHYRSLNTYTAIKGFTSGQPIHRSRVHWFRGSPILDDYDLIANQGCDDSYLELVWDAFKLYQPAVQAAGRMLIDFDVKVRKVKDLAQNLADRGDEYAAEVSTRVRFDAMTASAYKVQIIDMEMEALDNWTRQVAGMSDLFDRVKENLLASIDIPPAVAFGEFASGLNATGESTTEKQLWNETAAQFQIDKYDDNLQDLQRLVCLSKDGPTGGELPEGLGWEWLPPYPPAASEQAALELQRAQIIQTISGVDSRFGKVAIASTYGQKEYNSNITLPKPYADALQRDIKEEAKPQPTEPDVSALQGGDDNQPDETQPPEDEQAQQDQSIADDVLSDRTLLDSADLHLDDATPAKRVIDWHGFKLGLQYQPFDKRHGKVLPVAYGHIRNTKGADGMACDCYVGSHLESDRVFEVTQLVNGVFDEHKYMLGFDSLDEARNTFLQVMPASMFGGIQEVGLTGLNNYRIDSADVHLDASRSELLAKAKAKNEGLPKGKKFVVFGKTNAAIAEFVGEGLDKATAPAKSAAKPKGGTQGGKYQTKQTSSAIANAIAKKTGADPEAVEKDLRGKIQKAIDKTRREAKKAGKKPTDKELRAAARAVVKVEAKGAIAVARGEVKTGTEATAKTATKSKAKDDVKATATKGSTRSPKSKAAEVAAEKPVETKAEEKPQPKKSLRAGAAAIKAKASKTAPKSDQEVLESNGHNNFAVKERLRELAKLKPDDVGDKAYRKALLDNIDPDGSTESSLDRTLDQRRLREKVAGGKPLFEDDVISAGANLRQGMRGVAGSNNNHAQLEYSAQIYDRLNDKQKDAFALEAGKAVHDDPLHKEPRYAKLVADIKARHQTQEDFKDGKTTASTVKTVAQSKESKAVAVGQANPVDRLLNFKEKEQESIIDSRTRRTSEYNEAAKIAKQQAAKLPDESRLKPDEWKNAKATKQDRDHFAVSLWGKDRSEAPPSIGDVLAFQKQAKNPPYLEELMALKHYTKSEYHSVNKALRGEPSPLDVSTANRDAKLVTSMLNHLPDHKGTVYRGIGVRDGMSIDDIEKMYKPGSTVVEKAFTSTTPDKPEGQNAFARKPVQFVIKSKTGKNVQAHAHTIQEKEVLFRPDTAFKVSKVERDGDSLTIHMEESNEPARSPSAASSPKHTQAMPLS